MIKLHQQAAPMRINLSNLCLNAHNHDDYEVSDSDFVNLPSYEKLLNVYIE